MSSGVSAAGLAGPRHGAGDRAVGRASECLVGPAQETGPGGRPQGPASTASHGPRAAAARTLQQNSSWKSAPVEVEPSSDGREVATHVATEKESGDGTRGTQAAGGGTC